MKKIKEKYKDQDEEEKLMRMEILKSAGNKKNEPIQEENDDETQKKVERKPNADEKRPKPEKTKTDEATEAVEGDAVEDEDNVGDANDIDMLNSLTGCPQEEDEILFALPVVAPYNALQSYK